VRVLAQAAAGDVRHPLDVAFGQECQHRLDIDARRLEQRFAQRALAGDAGDLLREIGVRALEDAADQRKAVGMRAAGREPEQDVAGGNPAAIDRARFLDDADGESGEVVFAGDECLRMLGGLAAGQRASGLLAALRNAADDFAGNGDVERLADVVIEKEQRLGALDQYEIGRASCRERV